MEKERDGRKCPHHVGPNEVNPRLTATASKCFQGRWVDLLKKKKKLFIWLHQVFVAACRIFSCYIQSLGCGMWDLVP